MDALVIANIEDATASSEFLKSQKAMVDEAYANYNSYLYQGQMKSNSYMSMKQRVPMVMEFYLTPEQLYTVEMYINPQKMSFSHTKLIGKQVTRGGIFFHHYGEDAPKLTIQGNTGLSGMKGIEQLEKIFNYSGTLLRYQNVGINKIDNGVAEPRNVISLNDVIAQFDSKVTTSTTTSSVQNATEQQVSITETADQLFDMADVTFNTGEGLYSKAKAAQMVGLNLNLLYNSIDWSNKLAQLKSVIVKTNQIMSGKQGSFKDIYYVVLDLCTKETSFQDPSLDAMAFQIAYRMYSDQVGEVDEALVNNIDTSTLTMDMFVSQTSDTNINNTSTNINNNTATSNNVNLQSSPSNLVNVYKCVKYTKLYAQPSFSSSVLGELSVGGEFTAFVDDNMQQGWARHLSNGYAMIRTPNNTKEVARVDKYGNPLTELYMCKDPTRGYIESNYAKDDKGSNYTFYPGGFFTYSNSTVANNVTWFQHAKTGYWIPSGIYINNEWNTILQENTYLQEVYKNCYIYTAIRDDIKMYKEPNTQQEIKTQDGNPRFLYKGGKFTAQKIQGEWVQHINDNYWCQLSNNGQPNFIEGYSSKEGQEMMGNNANTAVNHMPDILTSNNDITLTVQETIQGCVNGFQQYLSDVRVWNKNSVVKRFEIESGIADIQSELTDEWLPRVVFIYFEDRVFLGHFDTFSYDRVAESENITYNMTFTIQRIISVTSISPTRFEQSKMLDNSSQNLTLSDYAEYEESLEYFAQQYALGNDLPLKIEILRTKCKYYYEQQVARYSGVAMSEDRKNQISAHHQRLLQCSVYNGQQQLNNNTPVYGSLTNTNYDEYIAFMTLGYLQETEIYVVPIAQIGRNITSDQVIQEAQSLLQLTHRIDGQYISPSMLQQDWCIAKYNDIIIPELKRTNDIWTSESSKGYVDERKATNEYNTAVSNANLDSITFKGTNLTLGALVKRYGNYDNIIKNVPAIAEQLKQVLASNGMSVYTATQTYNEYKENISSNRVKELFEHAQNLIFAIGARYANNSDFRQIYNNWLWQYNDYYGGSYPVQSTYKNKNEKITATINSDNVYERTFELTYNNRTYKFNVLNFSQNAKQNYAPVRYVLESIMNCECGWDDNKKRAICITKDKEILLDIETYLYTTIDEKTNKTTTTAYCPLSLLFQYLNFDYSVSEEGGTAVLRQEGITHIQTQTTKVNVVPNSDSKININKQDSEVINIQKSAKEKAQAEITEQDIRATIDWDKTTEADSAGREFVILDAERVIVMNVGEYYDITITGLKGYNLTYSIKKTGNKKIKCIDINTLKTQSNDGIIYKRIYAKQEGENTVVFTREKDGVSKDTKTMIIRCIPKID